MVDFTGTDSKTGKPARLVGAIVPQNGQTWFYKLMGDEQIVAQQKDAFIKFIQSANIRCSQCSLKRLVKIFTSLRLTVILLAFAIVLVFIGTLAQVDEGLYNAQARYFRQWLIFGLDLFGHKIPLILPGGYLIGTMLLLNLVAAHIYRFQLSVKKIGIQLAHAGVILLLVGQLVTDMLAHESQMQFCRGPNEIVCRKPAQLRTGFHDATTARTANKSSPFPTNCSRAAAKFKMQNLPFTIRVKSFWKNSEPSFRAPMMQNAPPLTTNGVAANFDFHPAAEAKTMDDKNVPTALIEIIGANGSLGDWVVSGWTSDDGMIEALQQSYAQQLGAHMAQKIIGDLTQPQFIFAGGKKFTFALRPERIYFPFSLKLLKATHTVYEGTDIPKDFRSRVQLQNPQTGENREVEISMNHPLRYAGLTFYQYQMDAGEAARAGRARAVVGVASRAQSGLVDALYRLRDGRRRTRDAIHVSPRRLHFKKENEMKKIFQKWFPPLLMLAMALWFLGQLQPPKDKDFAFNEFGKLPVVFNGRLKPMDSLARNSLLQIREKQTLDTRAVERLERKTENHFRDRMAGERDDESASRRRRGRFFAWTIPI